MASQPTQSVSLTPEQTKLVDRCIASGRFQSTEEVVSEGFRLLESEEAEYQVEFEKLRGLIQQGTEDLEANRVVNGREVIAAIKKRHQEIERKTVES